MILQNSKSSRPITSCSTGQRKIMKQRREDKGSIGHCALYFSISPFDLFYPEISYSLIKARAGLLSEDLSVTGGRGHCNLVASIGRGRVSAANSQC